MAKKRPAPVDPRTVPVPQEKQCEFCGKKFTPFDAKPQACAGCSRTMNEFWTHLLLTERHAGTRIYSNTYLESLPTWQAIKHFARKKFRHQIFTSATWTCLQEWLSAECGVDNQAFLRMRPTEVEKCLRDDAKAAPIAPVKTPPGDDGEPKRTAGESPAKAAEQGGKARLEQRVESLERKVKKRTKPLTKREKIRNQRIKFCCPRRRKKSPDTWNEIYSDYAEKYPDDKTASPDTLLHSHDRNCPKCREEKS